MTGVRGWWRRRTVPRVPAGRPAWQRCDVRLRRDPGSQEPTSRVD